MNCESKPARIYCATNQLNCFAEPMKFAESRTYADPEKAARRLVEIANAIETVYDERIYIELLNAQFLYRDRGTPAEYGAAPLAWS